MWDELLAAFGLMLVVEGILPFLSPSALRQSLLRMAPVSYTHLDVYKRQGLGHPL